jgi:hypothetical protein
MLVCFVAIMHILWACLLIFHGGPIATTATSLFRCLVPSYEVRALVYLVSGLLPVVLIWRPGSVLGLISVLPQQILLLLSGISAVVAISSGHFADGVVRPHIFIAADQGIFIVLAVLHVFESLDRFHERRSVK